MKRNWSGVVSARYPSYYHFDTKNKYSLDKCKVCYHSFIIVFLLLLTLIHLNEGT